MKNFSKQTGYQTLSGLFFVALVTAACSNVTAPTEQTRISVLADTDAGGAYENEFTSAAMQAAQDKLERTIVAGELAVVITTKR